MILKAEDKEKILELVKRGKNDVRVITRAHALNMRDKGRVASEIADLLELTPRTVFNIQRNYEEGGLENALYDDPRPGQPIEFDDRIKSQIVAKVCSDPPEGFDRWTLSLIQEKSVEEGIVESISHESIRIILQEHDLKPWLQKCWCVPNLNEEFVERMEDVLDIYALPLDEKRPVVCIDEKNTQLLDEVRPASGLAPGKKKKVDYEYKRNGSCNIFCAVQPLVGKYINEVTDRRTSNDFAEFLYLIEQKYKDAEKIIAIMDNLNTHKLKSLTEFYGKEEGTRIWNRFEIHYTPKHGSWLNQAEIAINMYARQCLGKSRIPTIELLKKKTEAWNKYINEKKVTIKWEFSKNNAQEKFKYNPVKL